MSINSIHTCCKKCVFAQYSDKTQTGCDLDYINKYRNNNVEIIEAYDEELEFYVVNSKKCIGYREEPFFTKLNIIDKQQRVAYVSETNKIQYLCVINLYNFDNDQLNSMVDTFRELSIKPNKIIFVRYNTKPAIFSYNVIKNFLSESGLECEWRIQTMVTEELSYADILHNIVNLNKKYRFILSISSPTKSINSIVSTGNEIVYSQLKGFNVISNESKDTLLFPGATYRYSYVVEKKNLLSQNENYIFI